MAIKFLNTVAVDTDVLYVDASSNRVGIGTTSPSVTLHVNGWTRVNGSLQLGGSNRQVMAINNTSLLLGTNNTERMRIDASGNVGIGTTSPSEKLVIADSVDNDLTTLRIENNFGNSSANGTGTALQFYGWDAGITANIKSIRTGQSYSPSVLTFGTYGGNGTTGTNSLSERMRIDDFGNVGIGTTSPEEKLQVRTATTTDSSFQGINVHNDGTVGTRAGICFQGYDWVQSAIWHGRGVTPTAQSGALVLGTNPNTSDLTVSGVVARMVINNAGAIKFNAYNSTNNTGTPTYLLGTDASGNIVKTNTIPGSGAGPYLPLSAGSGYPLTDTLYGTKATFGDTNIDVATVTIEGGLAGILDIWRNGTNASYQAIRFRDDTNANTEASIGWGSNQLRLNGTSTIVATTGGSERIRIDSSGNVGIGTTDPNEKLTIVGDGTKAKIELLVTGNTGESQIHFGDDDDVNSGRIAYNHTSDYMSFYTNNVGDRMIINSSGNVGIGTTSPNYKLEVNGGARTGGVVTYSKNYGSLDTTGNAVAGLTTSFNGASAGFTFTCFGHGGYQKVVYSCYNVSGTWNTIKVIDEGTNAFDVEASANATTITFTFKSTSGTKSYTPRVTVEATGSAINSTYA